MNMKQRLKEKLAWNNNNNNNNNNTFLNFFPTLVFTRV